MDLLTSGEKKMNKSSSMTESSLLLSSQNLFYDWVVTKSVMS